MTDQKITVIIPTYRRPQLLKRAILSVLNQTYPHIEVHVFDNHSQDDTPNVVAKLQEKDSRIYYHAHKKNIGGLANFQFGLSQVKTPFFALLSDDDFLFPWCYEELIKGFNKHPDAMLCLGNTLSIHADGTPSGLSYHSSQPENYYAKSQACTSLVSFNFPAWTSGLFRKEVLSTVGMLDESLPFADIDFLLRITAQSSCYIITKPCAVFSMHALGESNSPKSSTFFEVYEKTLQKIDKLPIEKQLQKQVRMLFSLHMVRSTQFVMISCLKRKDFDKFFAYSKQGTKILNVSKKFSWKLLSLGGFACYYVPPVRLAALGLLKLRRVLKQLYNRKKFKALKPYLTKGL